MQRDQPQSLANKAQAEKMGKLVTPLYRGEIRNIIFWFTVFAAALVGCGSDTQGLAVDTQTDTAISIKPTVKVELTVTPMPSEKPTSTPDPPTIAPTQTVPPFPSLNELIVPDKLGEVSFDGLVQVWIDSTYTELGLIDKAGRLVFQASYAPGSNAWPLVQGESVRIGKDGSITVWDAELKAVSVSPAPPFIASMIETLRSVDLAGLHPADDGGFELVNSHGQVVVYTEGTDLNWVFAIDMVQRMKQARTESVDKIAVLDLNGIEVTVDVVPPEVVEQGSWDWDLRGFVKETERGMEVWRTKYGPSEEYGSGDYPDLSAWHVVMDVMDLTEYGLGVLSVEVENPDLLAEGFVIPDSAIDDRGDRTKLPMRDIGFKGDEWWLSGLQHVWGERTMWDTLEVRDFHEMQRWRVSSSNFERPETPEETISKDAGMTVVVAERADTSLAYMYTDLGLNLPSVAFKFDSQSGRLIVTMFTGDNRKYIQDDQGDWQLLDRTLLYMSGHFPSIINYIKRQQANEQKLLDMLSDMNPVVQAVGTVRITETGVKEAKKAFGSIGNDVTELFEG